MLNVDKLELSDDSVGDADDLVNKIYALVELCVYTSFLNNTRT